VDIALFLILGAFVGLAAGTFGIGGGIIVVPTLLFAFHFYGFAEESIMHMAVASSLASIVLTSSVSVIAHYRRGGVLRSACMHLMPGLVTGAFIAGIVADFFSSNALKGIFVAIQLMVAWQLLFEHKPSLQRTLPPWPAGILAGNLIGAISALAGIGGGSLIAPYLIYWNIPPSRAVGTSAACGMPIAIMGMSGFILMGLDKTDLPAGSIGYVYLPTLLPLVITSMLFAPLGARIAHKLPGALLKQLMGVFLLLMGCGIVLTMLV